MAFPDTGNPGKETSLIDEINRLRLVLREQYQSKPFQEWCRSLQGMGKTSREPDRTPLSSQECALLICSGEAIVFSLF